jgi:hypothetical protein
MTQPRLPHASRIVVLCEDGRCRHLHDEYVTHGSFTSLVEAHIWADQGHVCTNTHTFVRVEVAGSQGCIVLPGYDGPSLWDCECASCISIQDEAYNDEGPSCSICDGLGHGYPGGPPCPLEVCDYSGEPEWAC